MLTGGQLVVLFRVTLLERASFWPRQGDINLGDITGEISLVTQWNFVCHTDCATVFPLYAIERAFIACVCRVYKALLSRNCNINRPLQYQN